MKTMVALFTLCLLAGTAAAQSAGQDGVNLYYSSGTWQCNKVRFPKGATSAKVLTTGIATVCAGGSCSNAPGDADLYVYSTTSGSTSPPGSTASGWSCRPYLDGNEETCSVTVSGSADSYFWGCVHGYSNYTQVQLRGEFNLGTSSSTTEATAGTTWWIDYWKNNLFLGVAYHRFGCFTNNIAIVDEREYDGFTDTDYCRRGYGLTDPATRGGESSYMVSVQYTGWSWQGVKDDLEACGTQANNAYVTPSYQRRSNSCSYNLLTNCNSDCWIKNFSACVYQPIEILSPCW